MKKPFLLFTLLLSSLFADAPQKKVFHAQDDNYQNHYHHSSHVQDTEEQVISSTAQVSAEITMAITVQATTEITSENSRSQATMSFLDNNRVQITEEIAKGEGEYLNTLLSMMSIKNNNKNLTVLQNNLNELIYLSHNDFLKKIEKLV